MYLEPQANITQNPRDPEILSSRVNRYYDERLNRTWNFNHPMKGRTPCANSVLMRSNDYLCVAGDSRIIEAEVAALRAGGHGESVSRIWKHHESDALNKFERRVAKLMGAEAAVLCNSGYCANTGLIQAICTEATPVYMDMKAHLSLWEGVKSAGAKAIPFRHNDAEHLARLAAKHGSGVVVVDAIYSIDGNVCELAAIIEVAERFECAIVLDETHSFGTRGSAGAGLAVELGLSQRVHFRTIGLSKAVSSRGGMVVCSERNAEFLRYEALPTIFSTSVLEHEVAGYDAALDIFVSDGWRRTRLHASHSKLRLGLDALGYNVDLSRSQIIALEAGDIISTVRLRDALEKRGVFGALFFPPATPAKRCLIRFTVNCGLTNDNIDHVIAVCSEIREEVELASWPSTRRAKLSDKTKLDLCA